MEVLQVTASKGLEDSAAAVVRLGTWFDRPDSGGLVFDSITETPVPGPNVCRVTLRHRHEPATGADLDLVPWQYETFTAFLRDVLDRWDAWCEQRFG